MNMNQAYGDRQTVYFYGRRIKQSSSYEYRYIYIYSLLYASLLVTVASNLRKVVEHISVILVSLQIFLLDKSFNGRLYKPGFWLELVDG